MLKFYKKIFIISIPFILYCTAIIVIDPFNYFSISNFIDVNTKAAYSANINYSLWKLLRYNETASENVILGDSRTAGLNLEKINKYTNKHFFDFSYGGGTLTEIINTFNILKDKYKLKTVCIGLGFNLFNGSNIRDRVEGAYSIVKNPLLYFSNSDVITSSYLCLKNNHKPVESIERPPMNVEEFWQYQLQNAGVRYYSNYKYPDILYKDLLEISDYCNKNNIELIFINCPTNIDLQNLISKNNLNSQYQNYLNALKSLTANKAVVADFDYVNDITIDKNNFTDPFHIKRDIMTDVFIKAIDKNYNFDDKYVRYLQ